MMDAELLLSLATVITILVIAGYLARFAYRHIKADTQASQKNSQDRQK